MPRDGDVPGDEGCDSPGETQLRGVRRTVDVSGRIVERGTHDVQP